MTKREMIKKIEELERRMAVLENTRVVVMPAPVHILTPPPGIQYPQFPGYPYVTWCAGTEQPTTEVRTVFTDGLQPATKQIGVITAPFGLETFPDKDKK